MHRRSAVAAWLAAAAVLTGCGGSGGSGSAGGSATTTAAAAAPVPEAEPSGEIMVFAAAPLAKAFATLGRRFHAAHPDVTVRFRFDSSPALAAAINDGTPADVFAVATAAAMAPFVDAGSVARAPATFGRDRRPDGAGTEYVIAPLTDSSNIVTAAAFVDLVVSEQGRRVLKAAGFAPA